MFLSDYYFSGGPQPAVLQKVNVPVWTNQECKYKYGPAAPGGIVDHFLCAGKTAKDSCSVSMIMLLIYILLLMASRPIVESFEEIV